MVQLNKTKQKTNERRKIIGKKCGPKTYCTNSFLFGKKIEKLKNETYQNKVKLTKLSENIHIIMKEK